MWPGVAGVGAVAIRARLRVSNRLGHDCDSGKKAVLTGVRWSVHGRDALISIGRPCKECKDEGRLRVFARRRRVGDPLHQYLLVLSFPELALLVKDITAPTTARGRDSGPAGGIDVGSEPGTRKASPRCTNHWCPGWKGRLP